MLRSAGSRGPFDSSSYLAFISAFAFVVAFIFAFVFAFVFAFALGAPGAASLLRLARGGVRRRLLQAGLRVPGGPVAVGPRVVVHRGLRVRGVRWVGADAVSADAVPAGIRTINGCCAHSQPPVALMPPAIQLALAALPVVASRTDIARLIAAVAVLDRRFGVHGNVMAHLSRHTVGTRAIPCFKFGMAA